MDAQKEGLQEVFLQPIELPADVNRPRTWRLETRLPAEKQAQRPVR